MLRFRALLRLCLLGSAVLVASPVAGEDGPQGGPARAGLPREVPDDPYVPSPLAEHPRSPATRIATGSFLAVQVNVDALGQNIVGDAANEPSLAVDPTDPDRMVIGWRQFDTIASNFRQAGYAFTTDGGATWTFPGVIEPGVFRSDPVLDSDGQGGVYYNSLTQRGGEYVCDVFGSGDAGMSWDSGTFAQGGDKQWMTIDRTDGAGDGNIYASWNSFFSSCPPGHFTRSTNGGASYQNCTVIPDEPYWGTLAVGPSGELYVSGAFDDDFVVGRSSSARLAGQPVAWELSTLVSLGGAVWVSDGPNPQGLLGQAWIATSPTSGPGGPTVYLLCSVNPPGADPLDVRFARSTDGGATWSPSVRLNTDAGNAWQWFGTMSVAPTGRIDVVWLDTRHGPGAYGSSLYYSYSTDEGVTWSPNERLSDAFDPHVGWPQQNKMGDYFHMVSDEQGFRLAWAATFNGEQDVYFGRKVLVPTSVGADAPAATALLRAEPNPFEGSVTIRYLVPRDAHVTLKVYDALGRSVATLVSGERRAGSYEAQLDGRDLAGGIYFCRLTAGSFQDTAKIQRLN